MDRQSNQQSQGTARSFKVNLNPPDSDKLKAVSDKLHITESDVIRKGLKLMSVFAKENNNGDISITVTGKDGTIKQIEIV